LLWPIGEEAWQGRRFRMERTSGPFCDVGAIVDPQPFELSESFLHPIGESCCIDQRLAGVDWSTKAAGASAAPDNVGSMRVPKTVE